MKTEKIEMESGQTELLLIENQLLRDKIQFIRDCFNLYSAHIKVKYPEGHKEADGVPSLFEMASKV